MRYGKFWVKCESLDDIALGDFDIIFTKLLDKEDDDSDFHVDWERYFVDTYHRLRTSADKPVYYYPRGFVKKDNHVFIDSRIYDLQEAREAVFNKLKSIYQFEDDEVTLESSNFLDLPLFSLVANECEHFRFFGFGWVKADSIEALNNGDFQLLTACHFPSNYNSQMCLDEKEIWELGFKQTEGKDENYYPRFVVNLLGGEYGIIFISQIAQTDAVVQKIVDDFCLTDYQVASYETKYGFSKRGLEESKNDN